MTNPVPAVTTVRPLDIGAMRIGSRTVRSADAASLRFAFLGDGPASTRVVAPLTARAQQLLQSPAGPAFTRALQRFASPADALEGRDNLRTVNLVPDVDALAAARLRPKLEQLAMQGPVTDSATIDRVHDAMRSWRADSKEQIGTHDAFNVNGDVFVSPDAGRALLASVGAYVPSATERSGPGIDWQKFLPHLLRHEVEHSVTPPKSIVRPAIAGLEEGIAETLSTARPAATASRFDLPSRPLTPVADALAATAGWRAVPRKPAAVSEAAQASNAVYAKRQDLVGQLLEVAGVDRHTRDGYATARQLLQGTPIERVPGHLADTIIARHDLDPKVREPLRLRIRDITESTAADPIAALRERFGIGG